jgi:Zn-dependent protease with chaperone function
MSSSAAAARPLARPAVRPVPGVRPRPPAPRLKVVAPARSGSRTGLALLAVALLAGGLITLLMLNISLSRGSYQLSDAQTEQRKLEERRQALQEEVQAAAAPQRLEARARDLGMVPAPNTAFVELPSGKVRGKPAEAQAPPKRTTEKAPARDGAARTP